MESQKSNLLLRLLALILGVFIVGMALIMLLIGNFGLWVGIFIGPLFIYYALVGNKGLLKSGWLSNYGNKIGK